MKNWSVILNAGKLRVGWKPISNPLRKFDLYLEKGITKTF
jgi:hypothetical protein